MPYVINFDLIRFAMIKKKMSNRKLAELLNVGASTVGRKLNGETEFTISESQKICDVLELNPNEIFFEHSIPNTQL